MKTIFEKNVQFTPKTCQKVIWKSDLGFRSRSPKKWSKIRSRSWSRYIEKSDLRSDQKVILRSWSWSSDQDHCYSAVCLIQRLKSKFFWNFFNRVVLPHVQISIILLNLIFQLWLLSIFLGIFIEEFGSVIRFAVRVWSWKQSNLMF